MNAVIGNISSASLFVVQSADSAEIQHKYYFNREKNLIRGVVHLHDLDVFFYDKWGDSEL